MQAIFRRGNPLWLPSLGQARWTAPTAADVEPIPKRAKMFKFIHAADIHLDSPLRGLSRYESAPVDVIRDACRRAFKNLVDLAIEKKAAFVLLAGDLYDGDWKDYSTGIFLSRQMGRLNQHDIQVFCVAGNHDAVERCDVGSGMCLRAQHSQNYLS